nr:hypothetical protein [Tanacetum cinerariifolium]
MSSASSAVTYTSVYIDSEPVRPLPPVDSPTAESPGYVAESDPEEYEDNKLEDGPVDYPMDEGDNDDGNSFGDNADADDDDDEDEDEDEDEDDEEEKEEHLALAKTVVVLPTVEPASISLPLEVEVERLLAMLTPPPSPLTSLSPPSIEEPLTRISSTQALIDAITAALPSPLLPPPLYIPPPVDRKDDILETEMLPRKRSCLVALGSSTLNAEARQRGIREVGYSIRDTWVDPAEARVDLLMEDRIAHQETIMIMEEEAYLTREAWAHLIGLSQAVHYEL